MKGLMYENKVLNRLMYSIKGLCIKWKGSIY